MALSKEISRKIAASLSQLALAVLSISAAAPTLLAQQPKWEKLAPFPEPAEEILGAAAGGKMYVFAGFIPFWKPKGLVYEYDPAADHWTKKKPMALLSHHIAFTEYHGKIYAFGGFVYPASGPAAWVPINNAWEYDPAADSWKALAPMPSKRGSPVAVAVGDKIYVICGVELQPCSDRRGKRQDLRDRGSSRGRLHRPCNRRIGRRGIRPSSGQMERSEIPY